MEFLGVDLGEGVGVVLWMLLCSCCVCIGYVCVGWFDGLYLL